MTKQSHDHNFKNLFLDFPKETLEWFFPLFLHFEYVFFKLFDFNARDYYNINNPVAKILLPKMNYKKDERIEVIRYAYSGLFQLASRMLFDKYVDFIDVYAQITEQEQKSLYHEIIQHKETAMLAQYIREKGMQQGMQQGIIQNTKENIIEALELRFGKISPEIIDKINQINDPAKLKELHKKAIQIKKIDSSGFFC